jgi:hypothetical protein
MSKTLIPMSEYVGAPDRLKIQELLTREGTTHPRILVDAATGQEVLRQSAVSKLTLDERRALGL